MKTIIDPDEIVEQLFETVAKKREKIKSINRPQWKTSCSFSTQVDKTENRINIQVVTDLNKLVEIYAFLLTQEKALAAAAAELGVTPPSNWLSYSYDDWKHDIKLRIDILNITQAKRELDELEAKLSNLVSPEQKRLLELKEIQKILGK